jgi:hypothetical protein
MWSLPSPVTVDGVTISEYSIQPEYVRSSGDSTIGVFCHEFGHVLGLPDFYDYDYSSEGLGNWSLMAGGMWNSNGSRPAHPDAWCKIEMGWVTPVTPTENTTGASLPRVETSPTIYKMTNASMPSGQYYLIENRGTTGFDNYLPGSGLCIYHVDDNQTSNDNEWYPGHTSYGHYQVALEQADGLWELEKGASSGDDGDPWPGAYNKRAFNDTSTPNTKNYSNTATKIAVQNISLAGVIMTADFLVDSTIPTHALTVSASALPNPVSCGATTQLSATATDNLGHGIASWSWTDNGAGGTFSPSAAVQNPTWTAPGNYTGQALQRQLTVTATCDGASSIAGGADVTVTENTSTHYLTLSASANPTNIASGGITQLSSSATDSQGHGFAAWSWSDNGAGGIFSPSADAQNPTWTAPGNNTSGTVRRQLTVTVTCDDATTPRSRSADVYVNEATHYLTVAASATPGVIASGGSSSLRATAQDNLGHAVTSWAWSDNGAGGIFTPGATVQNPTWTGPGNDTQAAVTHILTVTATCSEGVANGGLVSLTENPAPHSLTVTAAADPGSIASEGETQLSAEAQDNYGYDIATWSWTDHGAGGTFTPSASVQNPTYTGPGNSSFDPVHRHLTVTATCDDASALSSTAEVYIWEGSLPTLSYDFTTPGLYLFSLPLKNPDRVDGRWVLEDLLSDPDAVIEHYDAGTDTYNHIATWSAVAQAYTYGNLDDLFSPGQGYFMELSGPCSLTLTGVAFELYSYVQAEWNLLGAPTLAVDIRSLASTGQPTSGPWAWNTILQDYRQSYLLDPSLGYWVKFNAAGTLGFPPAETARLSAAQQSGEKPYLENASTLMEFSDVPAGHWAHDGAKLMRWLGITGGFANDTSLNKTGKVIPVKPKTGFKPTGSITRGQLAVFLCRAFDIPLSAAPQLNYADVSSDYWASCYIEAVTRLSIMSEYPGKPGCFCAAKKVTRAELAAALARAAGLPLLKPAPAVFSDVPAGHWAASEIAALSANGVFAGDPNLTTKFSPNKSANRGQLALYLQNLLDHEVK